MNKKELKEIYSNLSKNIELLNNFDIKTVPTYKETITKLFLIQKNNEYKVWSEKLTDESLLSVFDKEPFWEIKDLKNSFQPAFIFENIQAWGTFIKNTEKIEFEISNYKNKTFSELFNLQKQIDSSGSQNLEERVKIMLDLSEAKGWQLDKINVKGNDLFKNEIKR